MVRLSDHAPVFRPDSGLSTPDVANRCSCRATCELFPATVRAWMRIAKRQARAGSVRGGLGLARVDRFPADHPVGRAGRGPDRDRGGAALWSGGGRPGRGPAVLTGNSARAAGTRASIGPAGGLKVRRKTGSKSGEGARLLPGFPGDPRLRSEFAGRWLMNSGRSGQATVEAVCGIAAPDAGRPALLPAVLPPVTLRPSPTGGRGWRGRAGSGASRSSRPC